MWILRYKWPDLYVAVYWTHRKIRRLAFQLRANFEKKTSVCSLVPWVIRVDNMTYYRCSSSDDISWKSVVTIRMHTEMTKLERDRIYRNITTKEFSALRKERIWKILPYHGDYRIQEYIWTADEVVGKQFSRRKEKVQLCKREEE